MTSLRRTRLVRLPRLTCLGAVVLAVGATGSAAAPGEGSSAALGGIRFEEIAEAAGVRVVHEVRDFGSRDKAEVLEMFTDGGAAVAVGDVDGDGRDDLFVTSSNEASRNRLFLDRSAPDGPLRFEEVAGKVGVAGGNDARSIVADALWLDFDNDGRLDLLVARFGTPLLYRNLGVGDDGLPTFVEISAAAGLTAFGNTIAVIAFDADGDGWLDLLLGNYFAPHDLLALETRHVLPDDLDDAHNGGGVRFWRNVPRDPGGGSGGARAFREVTAAAGFAHHTGWSLDLGHADLDNDGDQDVYVAGDYGTDRLFLNDGDGTFTDVTEQAIGFDTRKGMNVDMGDFDRDGFLDVYVTNITDEYMRECNMLWQNLGDGTFVDVSRETGTCDTDWGWAGKFGDWDNDGWEDLYVLNGLRSAGEENYIPLLLETILTPGVDFSDLASYPDIGDRTWSGYQPQRLFRNQGDGTFREMAAEAGVANVLDGRGLGVGDFDRDGRLDFYQTNSRQESLLLRNVTEPVGAWIALDLVGTGPTPAAPSAKGSNRQAIGARVTVEVGGASWIREVNGGNGYAGQSTTRLHFGFGVRDEGAAIDRIAIRWPSGRVEVLETKDGRPPMALDRFGRIVEGEGVIR